MTVPPLFGWEGILTVVAVMLILAVAYLVIMAARTTADSRSEWQAFLAARSPRPQDPAAGSDDRSAEPVRPSAGEAGPTTAAPRTSR
jgi:hypothetical protein